jgi:hypothetical protein
MTLPIYFTDNAYRTAQKNVVETNITLELPYKTGFIQADSEDNTVDIEPGIELTVDDGCILIITEN